MELRRFGIFPSSSDAVLHCRAHRRARVDGCFLCLTADKVVTGRRAGQVAMGHVSTISVLELSRVMCRVPSGFASGCIRSDPDAPTDHDAVHGLRAAPEPDAALRQAVEVSQFVALVEQDFFNLKLSSYQ